MTDSRSPKETRIACETLHMLSACSCSWVVYLWITNSTLAQAVPNRFMGGGCSLGRVCRLREAAMREADVIGD